MLSDLYVVFYNYFRMDERTNQNSPGTLASTDVPAIAPSKEDALVVGGSNDSLQGEPADSTQRAAPAPSSSEPPSSNAVQLETDMSLYELIRTDFIRCHHCTEVYTYPCVLPCLHSFCGSCIDKLQQRLGVDGGEV